MIVNSQDLDLVDEDGDGKVSLGELGRGILAQLKVAKALSPEVSPRKMEEDDEESEYESEYESEEEEDSDEEDSEEYSEEESYYEDGVDPDGLDL